MSKVTLNNVSSLSAWTTAGINIDGNSSSLKTALENTLSRDGTSPNYMSAELDMNSNQVINLPYPSTDESPIRLVDVSLFAVPGPTGPQGPAGEDGNTFDYDTRTVAIASHVPSSANYIRTLGYTTVGDGGGATFAKVNSINASYAPYSITTNSGTKFWQYVPEPTGWNAKVAGIVADGSTEDSANLMNALLPFQNPTYIVGGGNLTGTLFLPPGVMKLSSPVIYAGAGGTGLNLIGQSAGNQGGPVSTTFQWHGTNYPSMFIVYSGNNVHLVGINYDGNSAGTNLINCIHLDADNTYLDSLQSPVTVGTGKTFTVVSTNFLEVGAALAVGSGTAHFEIVYVTSVTDSTHFVADCVNAHSSSEQVGGGGSCNSLFIEQSTFGTPIFTEATFTGTGSGTNLTTTAVTGTIKVGYALYGPGVEDGTIIQSQTSGTPGGAGVYVLNTACNSSNDYIRSFSPTTGVLCGNFISATAQVAEFTFHNCNFVGSISANRVITSYSAIRAIVGGNIKNYVIDNCSMLFFMYGIAGESFSGNVKITYPTFFGNYIADVLAPGGALTMDNYESETDGCRMLTGTGGTGAQNATLTNCQFQSGAPTDLYVIKWAGNLTQINNTYYNASNVSGASFTASISGFVMTVTNVASGTLSRGQAVSGSGVTGGTVIINSTADGGIGKYTVNKSQSVVSEAMTSTDPRYQLPVKIQCGNISVDNSVTGNPSAITSIGNWFEWASPTSSIFYDSSNNPLDYGNTAVGIKWRVFSVGDYGTSGQLPMLTGGLSSVRAALSLQGGLPSNISLKSIGEFTESCTSVVIPYTAIAASPVALNILSIPANTMITSIVVDVTVPFNNGTTTIEIGDGLSNGQFLKTFNAHTAAAQFGLVDADLGAGLASATRPVPGGYVLAGTWSGGNHVNLTVVGTATGNTAGSLTLYVTSKKYI